MSTTPLEFLFPAPSLSKSSLSPSHFPGVTPTSTETLQNTLKDNHVKWHVFFNDQRFHNHSAHRAIAAWALGAGPSAIQSGYEKDCGTQKPAIKSPQPITANNFEEHLGEEEYYSAYCQFFSEYVKEKGIPQALEAFVFSRDANVGTGPNSRQPLMITRFISGVLHPLIHTGYGAEFNLPGMIVEGLAMTAVTTCSSRFSTHLDLFDKNDTINTAISLLGKVLPSSLQLNSNNSSDVPRNVASMQSHALSILSRVLQDHRFAPYESIQDSQDPFEDTIVRHGEALAAYAKQWDVLETNIDKKLEELAWTVSILYGVAGWTDGKGKDAEPKEHNFNADFFLMHLVTSSLFLPALCALLDPASQVRLLKAYFYATLILAISRGQPALDVMGFASEMQKPEDDFLPEPVKATKNFDLWMRIIEEARGHRDEHMTKTIRSLAAWAGAFGLRKARAKLSEKEADLHPKAWRDSQNEAGDGRVAGEIDSGAGRDQATTSTGPQDNDDNVFPRTELPGSEYLDGGLFLHIAVLTLGKLGWDRDGVKQPPKWERKESQREEEEFWDFKGFFEQHKDHGMEDADAQVKAN